MVIFVSTLIIINYSLNSKLGRLWGLLCNLSKSLQSICYATDPSLKSSVVFRVSISGIQRRISGYTNPDHSLRYTHNPSIFPVPEACKESHG